MKYQSNQLIWQLETIPGQSTVYAFERAKGTNAYGPMGLDPCDSENKTSFLGCQYPQHPKEPEGIHKVGHNLFSNSGTR